MSVSFDRNLIPRNFVRLACVKHAASVRPEPGSNSPNILSKPPSGSPNLFRAFAAHFVISDAFRFTEIIVYVSLLRNFLKSSRVPSIIVV